MKEFEAAILFFMIIFLVVFGIYYLVLKKKLKKGTLNKSAEIQFLIIRYEINKGKVDYKSLIRSVALINSFIISFVSTLITSIPVNITLQLLIGFVLLFIMIYAIYEIYGRHINKKWGKKR